MVLQLVVLPSVIYFLISVISFHPIFIKDVVGTFGWGRGSRRPGQIEVFRDLVKNCLI